MDSKSKTEEVGLAILRREGVSDMITMDDVIKAFKCKEAEERIPVLRLELDYELYMLYEAIEENDEQKKNRALKRLYELRQELLLLEEF